jgi:hypothetical protein
MSQSSLLRSYADMPAHYEIRFYGRITPEGHDSLGGMQVTIIDAESETPKTILSGHLLDQAALAGVLTCIYDYGLPLISVQRSEGTACL